MYKMLHALRLRDVVDRSAGRTEAACHVQQAVDGAVGEAAHVVAHSLAHARAALRADVPAAPSKLRSSAAENESLNETPYRQGRSADYPLASRRDFQQNAGMCNCHRERLTRPCNRSTTDRHRCTGART